MRIKTPLCTAVILASLAGQHLNAQEDLLTRERSAITIRKGIDLHDEQKYEEAVREFQKVHRNDSNYYLASAEILNSYLALQKNEEGLALCEHLLKMKNDYTPNILIFKGDFLDLLNRKSDAERVFDQGFKEYPLNNSFVFEKAVLQLKRSNFDAGYDLLEQSARINPFHARSHYQLGQLAYHNNNLVCTGLAIGFYLIHDGTSSMAQNAVSQLEKMLKLELQTDSAISLKAFDALNDFSELESVLRSKVAIGTDYKPRTALTYAVVKQLQLIVENIAKYNDVKGFYSTAYGQFFGELNRRGFFEPYMYYVLRGMKLPEVDKWLEKHEADVNQFKEWAYDYICTKMAYYPENLNGQTKEVPHWFRNNKITAAGSYNAAHEQDGYWNFYFPNGIKKSEGPFVKGVKNGVWRYYFSSGGLEEQVVYENGAETNYKSFFNNGNPSVELTLANKKVNGVRKAYFSNGNLFSEKDYKDGTVDGTEKRYYRNGNSRYSVKNTNDVIDGAVTEYFDNGKIYQVANFVKGNREGAAKFHWNNAQNSVEAEGVYVKNNKTGEWKSYYQSGKLSKKENFDADGYYDGAQLYYHENGQTASECSYSAGKFNGVQKYYNDKGVLLEEFFYKKGKLLEYRAFKPGGEKICDSKINGRNFALTLYHPNGIKSREGKVSDGDLDGVWKDYSRFGVLEKESNYKEGKKEGEELRYYSNGQVKRKSLYVNGAETGYVKTWYVNGQLETEGMLVDGEKEGYWNTYYPNGTLQSKLYYRASDKDGWNEYYDVNGRLNQEELYSEYCKVKIVFHDTSGAVAQIVDLPGGNGAVERKSSSGKTISYQQYQKDLIEGKCTWYYPDGKTEVELTMLHGLNEGKTTYYSPLGLKVKEVAYFNGNRNGSEIRYFENGTKSSEYNYLNDDLHGPAINYFENGKKARETNYAYGDAEGESYVYDETGEVVYKRIFHDDLLVGYTYKDKTGNYLKLVEPGPGTSTVTCFFPSGKKSFEASYTNGDLNGKRTIHYSTGQPMSEDVFYYERAHGPSISYYPNGSPKESETYFYGFIDGKRSTFYPNGKLRSEEHYKLGNEHGWFTFYDQSGKKIKSVLYYNSDPILIQL